MDQPKIGAHETVGIEARCLAALVAGFDGVLRCGSILVSMLLLLVVVPAIRAHEFSAHGVREHVRTTVIVAGNPGALAVVCVCIAITKSFAAKGRDGISHASRVPASVHVVAQTRVAVGQSIALLAPQTGTALRDSIQSRVFRKNKAGIKDLAAVAAFGVLGFGVAHRTRQRTIVLLHCRGSVLLPSTDREPGGILESRTVNTAKVFGDLGKARPQSILAQTLQEFPDGPIRQKPQNIVDQNVLGKGLEEHRWGGFRW